MIFNKGFFYRAILAFLCAIMIMLSFVFMQTLHRNAKVVLLFTLTVSFIIFCMLEQKHKVVLRITTVVTVFVSICVIAYIIIEQVGWLKYFEDFDTIRDFILSTKQWGIIVFLLLTIMQVVFLPIPAAVTILIGVAIYGPLVSFLLSLLGTYIGSAICFWLGKSFGKKLVTWMVGKENADKYAKLLNEKGKWIFVLMLVFPFFPDDTLCLVAGTTTMTWKFFLLTTLIARPIGVAFTSFFGSGKIIPYSGWGIPVWIGIFVLCIILMLGATKLKNKLLSSSKRKKSE